MKTTKKTAETPSSTILSSDILSTAEVAKLKQGVLYPKLKEWPALAPAVAVYLDVATTNLFRIPVRLMRNAGLRPELGVNVVIHGDRVLMWTGSTGGPVMPDPISKNFNLRRPGLGPRLSHANFAVIEGPNYLVVTTREEALRMAGNAPIHVYTKWERVTDKAIERVDEELPASSVTPIDWQDLTPFFPNRRAQSGVVSLIGRLWWQAGFKIGDSLRIKRYANATVIEKCSADEQQSVLAGTGNGQPRHFIGTSMFNITNQTALRAIAVTGKIVITLPSSTIGAACDAAARGVFGSKQTRRTKADPLLDVASLSVLAKKDINIAHNVADIRGNIWTAAGLTRMEPMRMIHYAEALVLEPAGDQESDFLLGSASEPKPYRAVSLSQTGLANAKAIRILVCDGRVVLTKKRSSISQKFDDAPDWATFGKDLLAKRGRRPKQEPATEVSSYPVPEEGRRLQIQGRWLADLGFTPGSKFDITQNKSGVVLTLVETGGATVTAHSPGTSKLYVPAISLAGINAEKVRVLGRKGELQLEPLAA